LDVRWDCRKLAARTGTARKDWQLRGITIAASTILDANERRFKVKLTAVAVLMMTALTGARGLSAEVAGKWAGGKSLSLVFTFQENGSRLTGEVQAEPVPGAEPIVLPISEGRIEGDRISFTVSLGEGLKLLCSGIVNGDEIQLNAKAEGPGFSGGNSTVLKRVK
jgi:hypothetical protein